MKNKDAALKIRYAQRKRYYDKTTESERKHKLWNEKEQDLVENKYGMTDMEISKIIKRSVGSIQKKRSIMKSQKDIS